MTLVKRTFALVIFFAALAALSAEPIRVASFNLQIFGETKESRPRLMHVLGEIVNKFDVIAFQEIGSNGSKAPDAECARLTRSITRSADSVAGVSGRWAFVNGDQYAIVYRTDKFDLVASGEYSGTQTFTYRPLEARLKAKTGNLDFVLMTVHTRPELAEAEIPMLRIAMMEACVKYGTDMVACVGDYNADGKFYLEGFGYNLRGFDGYVTVIPNGADTTVSPNTNCAYDRIELTPALGKRFTKTYGVLVPSQSMDVSSVEGPSGRAGTDSAISDHYPVWCEFSDAVAE